MGSAYFCTLSNRFHLLSSSSTVPGSHIFPLLSPCQDPPLNRLKLTISCIRPLSLTVKMKVYNIWHVRDLNPCSYFKLPANCQCRKKPRLFWMCFKRICKLAQCSSFTCIDIKSMTLTFLCKAKATLQCAGFCMAS